MDRKALALHKALRGPVPTVAAAYDRRIYTLSETENRLRATIKPAVIDHRYSADGILDLFCAKPRLVAR